MSLVLKEESIASEIYFIRGEKVMLDFHLAALYGVETRSLKQQVKRNKDRFPEDFMFELTEKEIDYMVSQNVIPSKGQFGGALPFAFTEQGVAMLSSVLKSKRAAQVNIAIMRTFVRMRQFLENNKVLAAKIKELEKLTSHRFDDHDKKIELIFEAIRQLMNPPNPPRKRIGFKIGKEK